MDRRRGPIRFVRDVAATGGAQLSLAVTTMLAGILVSRFLGPDARGTLSVLIALGSVTVLLASFGIQQSSIYFLGRFPDHRSEVIANTTLVAIIGGLLATVLLAGAGVVFPDFLLNGISVSLFLAFVASVPFLYFTEFARRLALGFGRISAYNAPDYLAGSAILAGTAVLILVFDASVNALVVLRVAIEMAIAVALGIWLFRLVRVPLVPSWNLLWRQARYGVRNYAGSLLWVILIQSDLILCNYFLGTGPTGVYSVAVATGQPLTLLGSVVGILVFQRSVSQGDLQQRTQNTNRAVRLLVPVLAFTAIGLGSVAIWLIPIIYGSEFAGATVALLLLLPGLVAFSIEVVLMNYIAGEGSPPVVFIAPLVGVVLNVAANLVLIPLMGIEGAALTSSFAYFVVLTIVVVYYIRTTATTVRELLLVRCADVRGLMTAAN